MYQEIANMKKSISLILLFLYLIIPCFSIPNIILFEDNEPFFIIKYPKIYLNNEEDDYGEIKNGLIKTINPEDEFNNSTITEDSNYIYIKTKTTDDFYSGEYTFSK